MLNNKFNWTMIAFITFGLFIFAIISKLYWINIFVIILGILINHKGSPILFSNFKKSNKTISKKNIRRN